MVERGPKANVVDRTKRAQGRYWSSHRSWLHIKFLGKLLEGLVKDVPEM
jgi:hypothetical protein